MENKHLQQRCFPVKFAKFLRIPFSQNTSAGCFCLKGLLATPGTSVMIICTYMEKLITSLGNIYSHECKKDWNTFKL